MPSFGFHSSKEDPSFQDILYALLTLYVVFDNDRGWKLFRFMHDELKPDNGRSWKFFYFMHEELKPLSYILHSE